MCFLRADSFVRVDPRQTGVLQPIKPASFAPRLLADFVSLLEVGRQPMQRPGVAIAVGALFMGGRAASHWRSSGRDEADPNVA